MTDVRLGVRVGTERHLQSLERKNRDRDWFATPWEHHIRGALAELAFSRATHVPWDCSIGVYKRADFPPNVEIRSVQPDFGSRKDSLIIRARDTLDHVFVLVSGNGCEYVVWGWIDGQSYHDPAVSEPLPAGEVLTPNTARRVPRCKLRPIHLLPIVQDAQSSRPTPDDLWI